MTQDTSTRPLGAQISHMLKDRGVEVIFGIPGVHNQEMYRGIEEAGLTHILARHEQGAGFMADGYARASGRPGVCYVITGPGLCNIMTPMGQGYSDSVPMLVMSSCLDEVAATRGQLHQMKDQEAAAATVCDWSHTAVSADAAYALIDRALMEFEIQRKRPKHIQVPILQLQGAAHAHPPRNEQPAVPMQAAQAQAQILREKLTRARRPIFIFGGGAVCRQTQRQPGTSPDWLDPFLSLNAASFVTYAGRGTVPPDHPLHFGANLARPESADIIGSADLVVAVGTVLSEVDLWRHALGHRSELLRIDIDPEVLSDPQHAGTKLLGDAQSILNAALNEPLGSFSGWSPEEVSAAKNRWKAQTDAERPGIVPIAEALRAVAPSDTMFFSDMTQFAYAANEVFAMDIAGHWHHPSGFGTLGYGLPAAIGGAIARNGKPTMAVAGDYGFQYTLQELGLAVELELTLPILLWDNTKLKEIEDSMVRAQIAPNAVSLRNPDFVKLAQAYGAATQAPQNLDEFKSAVTQAFETKGPTLIYLTPEITRT